MLWRLRSQRVIIIIIIIIIVGRLRQSVNSVNAASICKLKINVCRISSSTFIGELIYPAALSLR